MGALASVGCVFGAFVEGAVMFIGGAVTFIGKGGLAGGRSFKTVRARVANNIKGVNGRDLR